jgi:hypothetical protein
MDDRIRRLRARLAALRRGKAPRGVRYPVKLRAEVAALARDAPRAVQRRSGAPGYHCSGKDLVAGRGIYCRKASLGMIRGAAVHPAHSSSRVSKGHRRAE